MDTSRTRRTREELGEERQSSLQEVPQTCSHEDGVKRSAGEPPERSWLPERSGVAGGTCRKRSEKREKKNPRIGRRFYTPEIFRKYPKIFGCTVFNLLERKKTFWHYLYFGCHARTRGRVAKQSSESGFTSLLPPRRRIDPPSPRLPSLSPNQIASRSLLPREATNPFRIPTPSKPPSPPLSPTLETLGRSIHMPPR